MSRLSRYLISRVCYQEGGLRRLTSRSWNPSTWRWETEPSERDGQYSTGQEKSYSQGGRYFGKVSRLEFPTIAMLPRRSFPTPMRPPRRSFPTPMRPPRRSFPTPSKPNFPRPLGPEAFPKPMRLQYRNKSQ